MISLGLRLKGIVKPLSSKGKGLDPAFAIGV